MSKTQDYYSVVSQEDQVARAALILASLEHEILEHNTFNELQKKKIATLSEYESRANQDSNMRKAPAPGPNVPLQLPEPGDNFDGTILPGYPPLQTIRDRIGAISPPFQKQLTKSDVSVTQSRLSLNNLFAQEHYLPLLNGDEDLKKGIRVTTYGPDGGEFGMDFKLWGDHKCYVLNNGWRSFCEFYKLEACIYWATIWMFRDKNTNRLCFALAWKINPSTTKLIQNRSKGIRIRK